jgi:hypothetical protein
MYFEWLPAPEIVSRSPHRVRLTTTIEPSSHRNPHKITTPPTGPFHALSLTLLSSRR